MIKRVQMAVARPRFAWGMVPGVLAGGMLFGATAAADILDTSLALGEDRTVVRELRRVELRVGEQDLYFDRIPAEADLSSLTIRTRRGIVSLRDWERVGALDPDRPARTAGSIDRTSNGEVAWRPASRAARETHRMEERAGMVRCRIHTLLSGTRTVELTYAVEGMSWESRYQVLVRDDPEGAGSPAPVDLFGTILVRNDTERDFEKALIRVIGPDRPIEPVDRTYRGFLALEEGPLAALWDPPEPERRPNYLYRLPHRATVDARGETEIHFVTAHRVPARRRYVLDADELPLTLLGTMNPLRKYLVFRNSAEHGLGWTLPPGQATVYEGVVRRHVMQEARLSHTPFGEDVWIDIGPEEHVLGRRRMRTQTDVVDGRYEQNFEIVIQNNRPEEIDVAIRERPHRTLSWDVVQAGAVYEREAARLFFDLTVPGQFRRTLEYRVRFHQPAL